MKIIHALTTTFPCFSFEFFPPATGDDVPDLMATIGRLHKLEPAFVSVTYPNTSEIRRRRTIEIVTRVKRELGLEAMAHLTCVDATRAQMKQKLDRLKANGIENVLALRGDAPKGETAFVPPPDGFRHSSDLAAYIHDRYDFCIGGGCYPEVHPDSQTLEQDLDSLAKKVAAGAQFLITQAFFENAHYFAFVERARAAGIRVPIVPGLMPITDVRVINRIATLDPRTKIPAALLREIERREGDPKAVLELGISYATLQAEELLRGGAPGIHFYTLNREPATSAIVAALRVAQPWTRPRTS
jgi:methylenetetrahydrofolate reductase (NADPH)